MGSPVDRGESSVPGGSNPERLPDREAARPETDDDTEVHLGGPDPGRPGPERPVPDDDTRICDVDEATIARARALALEPGDEYGGARVEACLGGGPMSVVYRARRKRDGRVVVLKILNPRDSENPVGRGRFQREALILSRLRHPNIVSLFDLRLEADPPYLILEFVEGEALDHILEEGALGWERAAAIARGIGQALVEAHGKGVIHRDIKPANVMIAADGQVKLLDFGIAKRLDLEDGLSIAGDILGTPQYMAPEQWGNHKVDARCDVYSLGATLYHMLTGVAPFDSTPHIELPRRMKAGEVTRPRATSPDVPEDLELLVLRMMEPDRSFRPAGPEECVEGLGRVLEGRSPALPALFFSTGRRVALVPGDRFWIGSDESCEVRLPVGPKVAPRHAEIQRDPRGFRLVDTGKTGHTRVEGMRVREVTLKDGDRLDCGGQELRFRDGGIGRRLRTTTFRLRRDPVTQSRVSAPLVSALAACLDRRVILALIEELAPDHVLRQALRWRTLLTRLYGEETVCRMARVLELAESERRRRLSGALFAISHENLGTDIESWLDWWDHSAAEFPDQLAPCVVAPRSYLVPRKTSGEAVIEPAGRARVTLGREPDRDVVLEHGSVSRHHATLLRLHTRYALRDEGSRFGCSVNGEAVRIALLKPGDKVRLGKVEMTWYEDWSEQDEDTAGAFAITPALVFALEEVECRGVALELAHFLALSEPPLAQRQAARPFFGSGERRGELLARLEELYLQRASAARRRLPELLGGSRVDWARPLEFLRDHRQGLPGQVLPAGWLVEEPNSRGAGEGDAESDEAESGPPIHPL